MCKVTVSQLFVCPVDAGYDSGDVSSAAVERLILNTEGIVLDRHQGRFQHAGGRQKAYSSPGNSILNLRQVSIVCEMELQGIADLLGVPSISGADVGANIVVSGIANLTSFPAGIHGVISFGSNGILYCTGENEPCDGPGKAIAKRYGRPEFANRFQKAAIHRRGIVAIVGWPEDLVLGDELKLFYPAWHSWKPV